MKTIEIIPSIFFEHNVIKLKSVKGGKLENLQIHGNQTILFLSQHIKELKREIKNYFKTTENKNAEYQNLRDTPKPVLRKVFLAINANV